MPNENGQYIALALVGCAHCKGLGTSGQGACICVDRSVFRIVLAKFRQCATGGHLVRPLNIDGTSGPQGRKVSNGRKNEEFCADVWLVAKRTLTNPTEWAVFRFFHLLGADWKLCGGRRLGMDKGAFFHVVYRVEQKLGRVFRELQPYPLYPIDEYFQGNTRHVAVGPCRVPEAPRPGNGPLRPPLAPRPVAPAPVPLAPVEALRTPEAVPAILDIADVPGQVRSWWAAGVSPRAIAARLNRMEVSPLRGSAWYASTVRAILIREQAPAKIAA